MAPYKRFINHMIKLRRDDPIFDETISAANGFPWRCDIWEERGSWPLFATAWGKTRTEAMSKANRQHRWSAADV